MTILDCRYVNYIELTLTPPRSTQFPSSKCDQVFRSLPHVSIRLLAESANAIITPVRFGISRPCALIPQVNTTKEAIENSTEFFSIPHPQRREG